MFERDMEPKACKSYEARLEDYLEGALASTSARQVESHLAGCERCRRALEDARASRELFAASSAPTEGPGPGFSHRVMAAVRAEERRRASRSSWWPPVELLAWRFSWSAMVAMAALLAYLVGFQVFRGPQSTVGQQTEVQDIFPESAPHPANQDDVLLILAAANTGKNHGK